MSERLVHLGCGRNAIPGWENLDLNAEVQDVTATDLRKPLAYESGTVTAIWSEHFIEHITRPEAVALMLECFRVLVPGGIIRLSTPDLAVIARDYLHGKTDRWAAVGRVYVSPAALMNGAMRDDEHRFLYDYADLKRLLEDAGFANVAHADPSVGRIEALCHLESRPYCADLIVEAEKP